MNGRASIERRNHQRLSPRLLAFVAVGGPNKKKVAHIVDISRGGIAFDYITNGYRFNESDYLDIFSAEEGFYLKELPFTTVSDDEVLSEFPLSFITIKRCGIKFDTLTPSQVSQLEDFLLNHTAG
jgi:hypothetical protein